MTNESLTYERYRTICRLPEEALCINCDDNKWISTIKKPEIKTRRTGLFSKTYDVSWDCIWFGTYPQARTNYMDGQCYEHQPICWRILEIEDEKALLLSDIILDVKPFNEDCSSEQTIRKWLNDEDELSFLEMAFSKKEQEAIVKRTEKVTLLTYSQLVDAKYSQYGFNVQGKLIEKACLCGYSDYAVWKGLATFDTKYGQWWLATPSIHENKAMAVNVLEKAPVIEVEMNRKTIGVRPLIKVDLRKIYKTNKGLDNLKNQ